MSEESLKNANLVLALDNCTPDQARDFFSMTRDVGVSWFKVGLELFLQAGPDIVKEFKDQGANVFLDLKLHDIPNTVEQAVKVAAQTGADLLTVHLSGGPAMIRSAVGAAKKTSTSLLGVSILTSFTEEDFSALKKTWVTPPSQILTREMIVKSLLEIGIQEKIPGIVCSAADLLDSQIHHQAKHFKFIVTPGIRLAEDSKDDQVAIATPENAKKAGATHLVVGRPITSQKTKRDVRSAAVLFLEKIEQ